MSLQTRQHSKAALVYEVTLWLLLFCKFSLYTSPPTGQGAPPQAQAVQQLVQLLGSDLGGPASHSQGARLGLGAGTMGSVVLLGAGAADDAAFYRQKIRGGKKAGEGAGGGDKGSGSQLQPPQELELEVCGRVRERGAFCQSVILGTIASHCVSSF